MHEVKIMIALQIGRLISGQLWPLSPHTLVLLPQEPGQGRDAEGDLSDSRQVDGTEARGCRGGGRRELSDEGCIHLMPCHATIGKPTLPPDALQPLLLPFTSPAHLPYQESPDEWWPR